MGILDAILGGVLGGSAGGPMGGQFGNPTGGTLGGTGTQAQNPLLLMALHRCSRKSSIR